jgi:hypothetical protein
MACQAKLYCLLALPLVLLAPLQSPEGDRMAVRCVGGRRPEAPSAALSPRTQDTNRSVRRLVKRCIVRHGRHWPQAGDAGTPRAMTLWGRAGGEGLINEARSASREDKPCANDGNLLHPNHSRRMRSSGVVHLSFEFGVGLLELSFSFLDMN